MPIFDEDIDGFSDGSKAKDPGMTDNIGDGNWGKNEINNTAENFKQKPEVVARDIGSAKSGRSKRNDSL
jgi:hypothetical protein